MLIRLVTGVIRMYQVLVSPFLGTSCRFHPSCSTYSIQSFTRHGLWRGSLLTLRRLAKCHPLHSGGYDPVPE